MGLTQVGIEQAKSMGGGGEVQHGGGGGREGLGLRTPQCGLELSVDALLVQG